VEWTGRPGGAARARVALRVARLREAAPECRSRPALSDRALLVAKCAFLLAAAALLLSRGTRCDSLVQAPLQGISLRCPAGWRAAPSACGGIEVRERTTACVVTLERLARSDYARAYGAEPRASAFIRTEREVLGGRPAMLTTCVGTEGCVAWITALASDIVLMRLYVPTEADLRRVQPKWRRMIRSVLIREGVRPLAAFHMPNAPAPEEAPCPQR
jgi:hypothetical protein